MSTHDISTNISSNENAEGDFTRVISIKQGKIDIDDWVDSTLDESDRKEWWRVKKLHEDIVDQAVEAGICIREGVGSNISTIKWTSKDIHNKWFSDRMDAEDREKYKNYWARYWDSLK